MKFNLVFDNSGDFIPFQSAYNQDLLRHFIQTADQCEANSFTDRQAIQSSVTALLNELHDSVTRSNAVIGNLLLQSFAECHDRRDYLSQSFLNRQHAEWVASQRMLVDVDQLRYSTNKYTSALGWRLHDLLPDDIKTLPLAVAMAKLDMIYPYEEVNMTVHRLEGFFSKNIEFQSALKWQVFANPFRDNFVSNNDKVNFSFGYTYVGRQYYDKWANYDTDLQYQDHYNYETLEFAFQINLARPQTIPYSKEFLDWCKSKHVPPITTQIPIGNVVDLEENLTHYRKMLYNNSVANNHARLVLQ